MIKSSPEFNGSLNDSICNAFGLPLNSGEFDVRSNTNHEFLGRTCVVRVKGVYFDGFFDKGEQVWQFMIAK